MKNKIALQQLWENGIDGDIYYLYEYLIFENRSYYEHYLDEQYVVYCFKNKINEMIYIGSTKNPLRRFNEHINSKLNDWHKELINNPNNFDFKIISRHKSREEAYIEEKRLIKEYYKNGIKIYNNDYE